MPRPREPCSIPTGPCRHIKHAAGSDGEKIQYRRKDLQGIKRFEPVNQIFRIARITCQNLCLPIIGQTDPPLDPVAPTSHTHITCNDIRRPDLSQFSLDDFLPYQLAVVSARVSREFSQIYAEHFDMSVPEWRVLVHLHNAGPVSIREIQARVDMDKSKVSRAASRLEKAGFLTKETNADDRRLLKLGLTEQGYARMEQIIPLANKFEQELLERMGADTDGFRETLLKLLKDNT
ncbi:hypothetical protein C0U40_19315 [Amylibacter cionae]|nr:hypothetical protein C0U40_19315 [Amylibacter cionae]